MSEDGESRVSELDNIYTCGICYKNYKSLSGLRCHVSQLHKSDDDQPQWPCPMPLCKKSFVRKAYLIHHFLAHTSQQPYICVLCNSPFSELQNLASHAFTFHIESSKETNVKKESAINCCRGCGLQFFGSRTDISRNFAIHFRHTHMQSQPLRCPLCDISFNEQSLLGNHIECHIKIPHLSRQLTEREDFPIYKCDLCIDVKFDRNIALHSHLLYEHQASNVRTCCKCGRFFGNCDKFLIHLKMCFPESLEKSAMRIQREIHAESSKSEDKSASCARYQCEMCGVNFFTTNALLKHYDQEHPIESADDATAAIPQPPKFACCECGREFDQIHKLEAHMNLHKITVGGHLCSHCDQMFVKWNLLQEHIRAQHREKLPFACVKCDKPFGTDSQLRAHRKTHNKQHQCNVCQKKFAQKCELNRHMVKHSDDKPESCPYCPKKFKFVGGMKQHVKNVHVIPSVKVQSEIDTKTAEIIKDCVY